jgi:hypothetical protein
VYASLFDNADAAWTDDRGHMQQGVAGHTNGALPTASLHLADTGVARTKLPVGSRDAVSALPAMLYSVRCSLFPFAPVHMCGTRLQVPSVSVEVSEASEANDTSELSYKITVRSVHVSWQVMDCMQHGSARMIAIGQTNICASHEPGSEAEQFPCNVDSPTRAD